MGLAITDAATHHRVRDAVADHLNRGDLLVATEYTLPSGRRADVIAWGMTGLVTIVEVRTRRRDSDLSEAMSKYGDWCDLLYLATPRPWLLPGRAVKNGEV